MAECVGLSAVLANPRPVAVVFMMAVTDAAEHETTLCAYTVSSVAPGATRSPAATPL